MGLEEPAEGRGGGDEEMRVGVGGVAGNIEGW